MYKILSSQSGYLSSLPLEVIHIQNHQDTALHTHDFSELVIIQSGSAVHCYPSGEYNLSAGDVFVVHQGQAHGYRDTRSFELVNFLFRLDQLSLILRDIEDLPGFHALFTLAPADVQSGGFQSRLRLSADMFNKVSERIRDLINEQTHRPPGWQFAEVGLFTLIITDVCRAYSQIEHPTAQALVRLGQVISFLQQHYEEEITLDDLAHMSHMSRRNLTREFTRYMGISPIEYLIRERVKRSMHLLTSTDISVSEAAFKVGFHDSNHFSRTFRAYSGHSPREFRKLSKTMPG
jgi:AraC-like DNA-binding protein